MSMSDHWKGLTIIRTDDIISIFAAMAAFFTWHYRRTILLPWYRRYSVMSWSQPIQQEKFWAVCATMFYVNWCFYQSLQDYVIQASLLHVTIWLNSRKWRNLPNKYMKKIWHICYLTSIRPAKSAFQIGFLQVHYLDMWQEGQSFAHDSYIGSLCCCQMQATSNKRHEKVSTTVFYATYRNIWLDKRRGRRARSSGIA